MRAADYSQVGDDVELIHPFDLYVLLKDSTNDEIDHVFVHESDKRTIIVHYIEDGVDKSYPVTSEVLEFRGKKYVQTTTVRPKTHEFDHMDCMCTGTKHKLGDHEHMESLGG